MTASPVRAVMVTHRDKVTVSVCTSLSREDFDKLEELCRQRQITKSEFMRRAILDKIGR